jgi:hypothetical protein
MVCSIALSGHEIARQGESWNSDGAKATPAVGLVDVYARWWSVVEPYIITSPASTLAANLRAAVEGLLRDRLP